VTKARRYAEEAIALDPAFSSGYRVLSGVIINEMFVGVSKVSRAEALQKALVLAEAAVTLDPSSLNRSLLSLVYSFLQNSEEALSEAEKAIALSPNSALAYDCMGAALLVTERFHEAIPMLQKSLRLSPIPISSVVLLRLGLAYHCIGQYEDAIDAYKRAVKLYPNNLAGYAMLACTYATVGRDTESNAKAAEVLKIGPNFSSERFIKAASIKNRAIFDQALNDLRKAGLK